MASAMCQAIASPSGRVGSEIHRLGGAGGLDDVSQHLLPFLYYYIRRRETVLDVDARRLFGRS
jgi:hypothetical protein